MSYNYDFRTAAAKIWTDLIMDLQGKFLAASIKALAKKLRTPLDDADDSGPSAEGTLTIKGQKIVVSMWFADVDAYNVRVEVTGAKKIKFEKDLGRFTPDTFAQYVLEEMQKAEIYKVYPDSP